MPHAHHIARRLLEDDPQETPEPETPKVPAEDAFLSDPDLAPDQLFYNTIEGKLRGSPDPYYYGRLKSNILSLSQSQDWHSRVGPRTQNRIRAGWSSSQGEQINYYRDLLPGASIVALIKSGSPPTMGRPDWQAGNTYLILWDDDVITIRFHQTDILTITPDNQVTFYVGEGAHFSKGTFIRVSHHAPCGWKVYRRKGAWYWWNSVTRIGTVEAGTPHKIEVSSRDTIDANTGILLPIIPPTPDWKSKQCLKRPKPNE